MITGLKGTSHNYGMKKEKICLCGVIFLPYHPRQKYHSEECQRVAARHQTSLWKKKNPHKRKEYHNKFWYGLSVEDYEKLKSDQDNRCAICENETDLFVDHDHNTSEVRGLLCHSCNTGIGLLRDDVKIMGKAIQYLKKEYGNDSVEL